MVRVGAGYKYTNLKIVHHKGLSDKELKDEEEDIKDPNGDIRKIIRQHFFYSPPGHYEININVLRTPESPPKPRFPTRDYRYIVVSFDKVAR